MLKISIQAEEVRSESGAQASQGDRFVPSDPYSRLSATRRPTQRYRRLWGLGIGECQDIAAPRPTVLRDILAEFNRRAQRRSRLYPNPPWRVVVGTPAGERQAGSSPQRVGGDEVDRAERVAGADEGSVGDRVGQEVLAVAAAEVGVGR
jgi:hypothetical protein